MTSDAKTPAAYLESLPEERRAALSRVRSVIRKNLPKGYSEQMQYGMIGWVVPHKLYPGGYHCDPKQPLPYVHLASQKNHMALYAMAVYLQPQMGVWLRERFAQAGKRLDMGKSCIRFRKLEDVPLDVIGELVAKVPVADYLMHYEDALKAPKRK